MREHKIYVIHCDGWPDAYNVQSINGRKIRAYTSTKIAKFQMAKLQAANFENRHRYTIAEYEMKLTYQMKGGEEE